MLKIQEIREIIKLIDQSSIGSFSYEAEGTKITLEKEGGQQVASSTQTITVAQPVAAPAPVAAPVQAVVQAAPVAPVTEEVTEDASLHKVTSPMVGTFYAASSPDVAAYVQVGDKVTPEGIICIVEAMKLFNEIEAEVTGEIVEILVTDGQLVEYGQPLFLVKTV